MLTVIQADSSRRATLEAMFAPAHPQWILPGDSLPPADVYVGLDGPFPTNYEQTSAVFLNDVLHPRGESDSAAVVRFNGWPGCIEGPLWECAGNLLDEHRQWANVIGKTLREVPDVPGFISARVISAIINEAYFALGDGISTPEEIDTAMQLGTNYPQGPFAWAKAIGIKEVFQLLNKLSSTHPRYTPAPALAFIAQS
jgi:3-hydroxybutyryl-CoA dehydrogenase